MRIPELLDKRRRLIEEARGIINKAEAEKRDVTSEENARYDAIFADVSKLTADVERLTKLEAAERSLTEPAPTVVVPEQVRSLGLLDDDEKPAKTPEQLKLESRGMAHFLRGGVMAMRAEEQRALEATTDSAGGYLFAAEQFLARLIVALNNAVFMRTLSTVIPVTSSDTLGVPNLATDVSDPAWTPEISAVSEDSSLALGKRALTPQQLTKLVKVSMKLLRIAAISPEQLVANRFAYKFSLALENGYLNGSGTAQPLGIFTASANGIPTSRDVASENTATDVTLEGLLNALYSIKGQYRSLPSFAFVTSRELVKRLSKFRDNVGGAGTGQFLWEPSIKAGEPDRLKGVAVKESELAPATFTTGLYVGCFGAFEYYWIADLQQFWIQRLNELFALNSQVGFIGRLESDGQPILPEAFARVKLG